MSADKLIPTLEKLKRSFGTTDTKFLHSLTSLSKSKISDAQLLDRFHEALLFLRAYPPSARVLKLVEQILRDFPNRISQLRESDDDLSPLDDPEVSGIAGTSVTSNFSYVLVRWLVAKYPNQVSIDWDWIENEEQFGTTMSRFLPLLEEDAMVEAHVPYREWLTAAKGRKRELSWLIERFESLPVGDRGKAELYDSLKLHVTWRFGFRSSRTGMKLLPRKIFFHDKPLIRRRDISLTSELDSPQIPVERLSRAKGEKILDLARETSAVRYRELHGFTYGDPARVLKADLGRGTEAFVMGVTAEHRLPLRAYHAALIFKNGVPVAYFEGLSIFERMESGFNLYYTFRDGETAWLYARTLRLMRQLLGVTVFSIDPYQIGHENEEGIASGAFWFYRKLGFRPVRRELMKLTDVEERRIAKDRRHRSSPRTLRKLATGHMLYELAGRTKSGEWDRFAVRNLGLAIQSRMGRHFDGSASQMRKDSIAFVRSALNLTKRPESKALNDLALVFAMIPDLKNWDTSDRNLAAQIIAAKISSDEAIYLQKMQKHASLRAALIRLGSDRTN